MGINARCPASRTRSRISLQSTFEACMLPLEVTRHDVPRAHGARQKHRKPHQPRSGLHCGLGYPNWGLRIHSVGRGCPCKVLLDALLTGLLARVNWSNDRGRADRTTLGTVGASCPQRQDPTLTGR